MPVYKIKPRQNARIDWNGQGTDPNLSTADPNYPTGTANNPQQINAARPSDEQIAAEQSRAEENNANTLQPVAADGGSPIEGVQQAGQSGGQDAVNVNGSASENQSAGVTRAADGGGDAENNDTFGIAKKTDDVNKARAAYENAASQYDGRASLKSYEDILRSYGPKESPEEQAARERRQRIAASFASWMDMAGALGNLATSTANGRSGRSVLDKNSPKVAEGAMKANSIADERERKRSEKVDAARINYIKARESADKDARDSAWKAYVKAQDTLANAENRKAAQDYKLKALNQNASDKAADRDQRERFHNDKQDNDKENLWIKRYNAFTSRVKAEKSGSANGGGSSKGGTSQQPNGAPPKGTIGISVGDTEYHIPSGTWKTETIKKVYDMIDDPAIKQRAEEVMKILRGGKSVKLPDGTVITRDESDHFMRFMISEYLNADPSRDNSRVAEEIKRLSTSNRKLGSVEQDNISEDEQRLKDVIEVKPTKTNGKDDFDSVFGSNKK